MPPEPIPHDRLALLGCGGVVVGMVFGLYQLIGLEAGWIALVLWLLFFVRTAIKYR
jgi:hypothetical protein